MYSSPTAVAMLDEDMRSDDIWTAFPESSSVAASPVLGGIITSSAVQLHHPTPVKHLESTPFLDDNPNRYPPSSPFQPELRSTNAYEHVIPRLDSSAGWRVGRYAGSGLRDDSQLQTFYTHPPSSPRYVSNDTAASDIFESFEPHLTNASVQSTSIGGLYSDFSLSSRIQSDHPQWSEDVPMSSPVGMKIAHPLSQRYSIDQSRYFLDDRNNLGVGGSSHSSPPSPNLPRPRNDAVSDALLYTGHSFIPPPLLAAPPDMVLDLPPPLPERVTPERSLMNDSPLDVGDKSFNSHPSHYPLPSFATYPVRYSSPDPPVTPNFHFQQNNVPRDPYEERLRKHATSEAFPPIPALNFDLLLRNRVHQNQTRLVFEETWSSRSKGGIPGTAERVAPVRKDSTGSDVSIGLDPGEPNEDTSERVQPSGMVDLDARAPRAPVTPPYNPKSLSQNNFIQLSDPDLSPSKVYRATESSKFYENESHSAGFSEVNMALSPVTPTRISTLPIRVADSSRGRQPCSPRGWVHPEDSNTSVGEPPRGGTLDVKHYHTISAPLQLQAVGPVQVGIPQRPSVPSSPTAIAIQSDADKEIPIDSVDQDLVLPEEVDELCDDSLIKDDEDGEDISQSSSESGDDGWEQLERDGGDAYRHQHLPARATTTGRHERTKASGSSSYGNHMVVDVTDDECGSTTSSHDSIESWSNEDVLAFLKGELER